MGGGKVSAKISLRNFVFPLDFSPQVSYNIIDGQIKVPQAHSHKQARAVTRTEHREVHYEH